MSFMDGFVLRAGEAARERNMLDIQNKIAKHKAFADHLQKISEDPAYSPDAQEAAKNRWLDAISTDPLKFKKYDISDILTVTNPRMVGVPNAPQNERPSILPSGSEGRTLFEGWEKTLPGSPAAAAEAYKGLMKDEEVGNPYQSSSGEPHQFGDIFMYTPRRDTGYDPATRSGKWTPEEAAYLEAQTAGMKYANTIATKPTGYTSPGALDGRAQTSGADLIAAGYTETTNGTPIDPNKVYITGTNRNSRQFFIGEAVAPRYSEGPVYTDANGQSVPSRWNPQQGVANPTQLPQGYQMQVPTDAVQITSGGKHYEARVERGTNNLVTDADGAVNLVEVTPPPQWAPQTNISVDPRNTGGTTEYFQSERTTQRTPPDVTMVPNIERGTMTLGGKDVKINGNYIRYEHRDPNTRALLSGTPENPLTSANPAAMGAQAGAPPTPPPPSGAPSGAAPAGMPPPAITPIGRTPAAGTTTSEQLTNRTQPIRYDPTKDNYIKKAPDLSRDTLSVLPPEQSPYHIANANFIPKRIVLDVNSATPHLLRTARSNDDLYGDPAKRSSMAGVHKPGEGPVVDTPKAMTESQLNKLDASRKTLATTSGLLTELLQPDKVTVMLPLSNRLRAVASSQSNPWIKMLSSKLRDWDPSISEQEKQLIEAVAAVRKNLSEHIQVIRTPLGAAGFRSLEAFWALQEQYGDLFMNPRITTMVMRNTLKTVLTIKAAYDKGENISRRMLRGLDGKPMAGPNYPSAETRAEYLAAYGYDSLAASQAMLRDGYEAPPMAPTE